MSSAPQHRLSQQAAGQRGHKKCFFTSLPGGGRVRGGCTDLFGQRVLYVPLCRAAYSPSLPGTDTRKEKALQRFKQQTKLSSLPSFAVSVGLCVLDNGRIRNCV